MADLKVKEAAEFLNCSQQKVRLMIARREIDVIRHGRALRLPTADLERLRRESTIPAIGRTGDSAVVA